jgi:hypothetical protein
VSDERRFYASVNDESKLVLEDRIAWAASLSDLRGQRVVVTITKPKKHRSVQANKFWWSLVVPTFQEVWSNARDRAGLPEYTKEETHDVLVQVLAGCEDGPLPGSRVRKRTSEMSTAQFSKMIDDARELALHKYGMAMPAPGESWDEVT